MPGLSRGGLPTTGVWLGSVPAAPPFLPQSRSQTRACASFFPNSKQAAGLLRGGMALPNPEPGNLLLMPFWGCRGAVARGVGGLGGVGGSGCAPSLLIASGWCRTSLQLEGLSLELLTRWWCAKCLIKCFPVTSRGLCLIKFQLPVLSLEKPLCTAAHCSFQAGFSQTQAVLPWKNPCFPRNFSSVLFFQGGSQSDPKPVAVPRGVCPPLWCCGSSSCADPFPGRNVLERVASRWHRSHCQAHACPLAAGCPQKRKFLGETPGVISKRLV